MRLAVWLICVGALTGCTPEDAATRLSRECISLVDLVLKDKQTVQKEDLARELKQRGVSAPIEPIDPFSKPNPAPRSDDKASLEKWLRDNADRNAKWLTEQTAYEAWWRDIKEHAAYSPAWDAAFARKRNTAIQRCIEAGAAKQGVTIR